MKLKTPIILASQSARRRELLARLGVTFRCINPSVEECASRFLTPTEIARTNAHRKALTVARRYPDALVIGSDTVVALGSKVFGKPRDLLEAFTFLKKLSGSLHDVITGVSMIHAGSRRERLFSVHTSVAFQALTKQRIREYLSMINPLDKAGAYAIQEHGEWIIGEIHGSYTNVVGLPMEHVREALINWEKRTS
ncbi:MAG: Maf family protein [Verrucomicrobiota bacterium]|jgi:septum formation protein|nr:Maf family protein [Verrucomicrobiota bacterium]